MLFSLWILINILQFFVYIALWQITFPDLTRTILLGLRRVAMGEFMDDLEIGDRLAEFFGLSAASESKDDLNNEKVGNERLGSKFISENMGVTFTLIAAFVVTIILLVFSLYCCCKSCGSTCSKCKELMVKLKDRLFWNPIIRYTYEAALKYNQVALLAIMFGHSEGRTSELLGGIALLLLFAVVIPGIYIWLLVRHLDNLDKAPVKQKYGTLFTQLALDDQASKLEGQQNHHIYI